MRRKEIIIVLILTVLALQLPERIAHAAYVLPYPSYMPGNKLYKVSRILDRIKKYWYWGNIASFKYHLELSDKYLVEAKTLFEYSQYLLAVSALTRSDEEFTNLNAFLQKAQKEGKDTRELRQNLEEASDVHIRTLERIKQTVPESFVWTPEKSAASTLPLHLSLDTAIRIRQAMEAN